MSEKVQATYGRLTEFRIPKRFIEFYPGDLFQKQISRRRVADELIQMPADYARALKGAGVDKELLIRVDAIENLVSPTKK